jgi:hypothetical protein
MANKYYTNRYSFWSDNKSNIVKIDRTFDSYGFFEKNYFSDDLGVVKFFNLIRDRFGFPGDLTDVYQKFACDLVNNTTYCETQSSGGNSGGGNSGGGQQPSPSPRTGRYRNCPTGPYTEGCRSEVVRKVQVCLGVKDDSLFGPKTQGALESRGFPNGFTDADVEKICKEKTETGQEETTTVIPDKVEKWVDCIKKLTGGIKTTVDKDGNDVVLYKFGGKDNAFFWEDGTLVYVVSKSNERIDGEWSCVSGELLIETEDGQQWTKSTGWVDKVGKSENPDQDFGGGAPVYDVDISGTPDGPTKTPDLGGSVSDSEFTNESKSLETVLSDIDKLINEENMKSLLFEQRVEVVQAPKEELNILQNQLAVGTLTALCRSANGTSQPVNVNNKIYFAGKKVTFKKDPNSEYFIVYDGLILKRVGTSCNFEPLKDEKGLRTYGKIPYKDLQLPMTTVLKNFGIDPNTGDPYYLIDTTTKMLNQRIEQGARSPIFKNWQDMLTYWYPNGEVRLDTTKFPGDDDRAVYVYPQNFEVNQYRPITAKDLNLTYLGKDVVIYLPIKAGTISTDTKIERSPEKCKEDLVKYIRAAFEFQKEGQKDESINIPATQTFLQGCYRSGMLKDVEIDETTLGVQFIDKDNPFKGLRGFGDKLDINEIMKLLIGDKFKLQRKGPAGINPYTRFYLDRRAQNESTDNLKNIIKENLIRHSKQNDKNLISEKKIIQTRTNLLLENRILKFSEPRERFFNELISEISYLEKQKFNKELIKEEFWGKIKGLFGDNGSEAIFGTFKDYMSKWLVGKLTSVNPNGWMGTAIKKSVKDIRVNDIDKLTDCDFMTKRVSSSITDEIINKMKNDQQIDGGISKIVKGGLTKSIDRTELLRSIEEGVSDIICPELGNVDKKLKDKAEEMKSKAIKP